MLAVIVEDVRRTEARFKELEERFKKEVSDIRAEAEKTETALRETVTGLEAELRQTFVEHLKYHTSAERQLAEKIETDASSCFEAAAVRLTKVIEGQAATAEFSRVDAEIAKHADAIRHLDMFKRDGAGLRGGKPELLKLEVSRAQKTA